MSSRVSRNSEADAAKNLENLEKCFLGTVEEGERLTRGFFVIYPLKITLN